MNRHIKVLLIIAVVLLVASCKKDEDLKIDSKIVGAWELKDTDVEISVPGDDLRFYLIDQLGMSTTEVDSYVTYLESGEAAKFDLVNVAFRSDGSYEGTGESGSKSIGIWETTVGNKAVIFDKGTGHDITALVETVDDTQLVLKVDMSTQLGFPKMQYLTLMSFDRK